jgi:PAS domain S-box-containing protein
MCFQGDFINLTMEQRGNSGDFKKKFNECNDKFDTIFRLTSVPSKIIDSDLKILKTNDALSELLGYPKEEIEGTHILDYACEEYKKHWHDLQEKLWKKKLPFFKLEACLIRKDKTIAWVDVTTILFEDEGVTYGFTVLDDITGEKGLQESEKRLSVALQYSGTAVWEMNLQQNAVKRSEAHDQLFGYTAPLPEWTVDTYMDHICEDDLPRFKEALSSMENEGVLDFQGRIVTANDSVRWVSFQGKAEYDEGGNVVRILGTINDITKEKMAERHKDDFISIASHELKTPVTTLKGSLQLLDRMKDSLDPPLQGLVTQANKSIEKVTYLIDDLLNASLDPDHQLEIKRSAFNAIKLIEECTYHLRLQKLSQINIQGDGDVTLFADAERIERVVLNLIDNALKYAPDGDEILVLVERIDDAGKISVKDTGPGIPFEIQSRLFERYYQAGGHGSQYSGLGLGLYISSEIIRRHEGKMGVDSKPGAGSTFWFSLPLSSSH